MTMARRLWYEARVVGGALFGLPVLVAALFAVAAALMRWTALQGGQSRAQAHAVAAQMLLWLLEVGLPPAAGFAAATIAARDPARELLLSLPAPYPAVIAERLGVFTAWAAVVCAAATAAIGTARYWAAPQGLPAGGLAWAAPLAGFVGMGALAALLLRSRAAGAVAIGMLWMVAIAAVGSLTESPVLRYLYPFLTSQTLPGGHAPHAPYWLANRVALLTLAATLGAGALGAARRSEALLGGEE